MCLDIEERGTKPTTTKILAKWAAKLLRDNKSVWSHTFVKQVLTLIVNVHSALNATVDPKHNQATNKIDSQFW